MASPKFRPIKLGRPNQELSTAIPVVLQSNYKWDNEMRTLTITEAETPSAINQLKLVPEALELLKTVDKPVAVLSVCGPFRTGKSFFVSHVVGGSTFKLGHSMDGCTRGIWLSTTALECNEFVLLVLDTEGIGAVEGEGPESFTTKLLVTTILLSSFLVYNSMEVPKKADLQQMSSFAHLSTAITIGEKGETRDPREFQKHFPQFMWLLRDVVNLPTDDEGKDIPLVDYLKEEVLKATGQKDSDNVIDAICTLFPQSLSCVGLPPPNENLSLKEGELVDKEFSECLNDLIDGESGIKARILPKEGFGGEITGYALAELMKNYIAAINEKDSVPSLEGAWMAVIKLQLSEKSKELARSYEAEMEQRVLKKLPMEHSLLETDSDKSTLVELHKDIFKLKQKELCDEIHRLLPQASPDEPPVKESEIYNGVMKAFEQDIMGEVGIRLEDVGSIKAGVLLQYVTQNMKESEKQCEGLWEELENRYKIRGNSMKALNQCDLDTSEKVRSSIQQLREHYNTDAVGPARDTVRSHMNESLASIEKTMSSIPGPPEKMKVVGKAKDKIKLQWEVPIINPEAAKKYIVKYRAVGKEWNDSIVTAEQWHIIQGLKSNTKYEFEVASWNDEAYEAKEQIEAKMKGENLKMTGTRLGILARSALSVIGFISGTTVAPILAIPGAITEAKESTSKLKAAGLIASIPFLATFGAPIVGGRIVYHVIKNTDYWGDLEERYVPQDDPESSS